MSFISNLTSNLKFCPYSRESKVSLACRPFAGRASGYLSNSASLILLFFAKALSALAIIHKLLVKRMCDSICSYLCDGLKDNARSISFFSNLHISSSIEEHIISSFIPGYCCIKDFTVSLSTGQKE